MLAKGKTNWVKQLAVVMVLPLFLAACSSGGENQSNSEIDTSQKQGGNLADNQVLHLSESSDITSLDIHHATDAISFEVDYAIFSGLMRQNYNEDTVPDLAKEMPKVSNNKTVYTFKIRDDAKWSDGSPVTAQNFVYAWKRDVNPKEGGEYAYIFGSANIKNASKIMDKESDMYGKVDKLGVKALDKKTLKVTLDRATPYLLSLMAYPPFFPLKKSVVEKYGNKYATSPDRMVYNGAYTLTDWQHGEGWEMKKNPKWWDANHIKINKVDFKVVKDTSTALNLYQTGKLDYVELTSQYIDKYKNKSDFHKGALQPILYYLKMNTKDNKALANKNIRDAIYNAIDRKSLVDTLMKNGSLSAYYYVPKGYTKGPKGDDFRYNVPPINKKSLKDAKSSWEKGLQQIGKKKIELTYLTTDTSTNSDYAAYIKNQLEKNLPGLSIKINKQPAGNYYSILDKMTYELALADWIPDYSDPMTYLDNYTSSPTRTYSNPEYDKLVEEIHHSGSEPEKRWKLMHKAEKVLLNDAALVPLWQTGVASVEKPYVNKLKIRQVGMGFNWMYTSIKKH